MYEHYNKLSHCLDIFYKWSSRGLITGQIKEKYETTRWYVTFGVWGLHGIFYPGHIYYRWPKWTWKINELSQTIMEITGIMFLLYKWQKYCYAKAYEECFKKYPEVILDHCIDYPEFLFKKDRDLYNKGLINE